MKLSCLRQLTWLRERMRGSHAWVDLWIIVDDRLAILAYVYIFILLTTCTIYSIAWFGMYSCYLTTKPMGYSCHTLSYNRTLSLCFRNPHCLKIESYIMNNKTFFICFPSRCHWVLLSPIMLKKFLLITFPLDEIGQMFLKRSPINSNYFVIFK